MRVGFSRGYLRLGSFRGAPVRVHATTPLGLLVVHELGHAFLVSRCNGRVLRLDILPFGGECAYDNVISLISHSVIAWGGVLAQGILFALATLVLRLGVVPPHSAWRELAGVLLSGNLILIAFNLLPIGSLDGARAWKLFPLLVRRFRFRRPPRRK
jgi:Zn-dependent protease